MHNQESQELLLHMKLNFHKYYILILSRMKRFVSGLINEASSVSGLDQMA